MNTYEAILKRRSIRKFKQEKISKEALTKLANAARVAPQAANLQPLKYIMVNDEKLVEKIFPTLGWAAYIRPEGDPKAGERPTAYAIVLCDTEIKKAGFEVDAGAAVENLILTAVEEGIGSCWLATVNKEEVREILSIPERYSILYVIALGYPAESPEIYDEQGSIKYYKDEAGMLHVPKRKLEGVVFYNRFE